MLGPLAALPVVMTTTAAFGAPGAILVSRSSRDPRWVTGVVTIAAPRAMVWSKLAAVADWPSLFTDMVAANTRRRAGDHWELSVVSKILGHHAHDYIVDISGSGAGLRLVVSGVDAHGTLSLSSTGDATTLARFDLFASTAGAIGWFVSEKGLREKQEALVRSYLGDLARSSTA